MKQIRVLVTFPYDVTFIKWGHQLKEGQVVWDQGDVLICEVDERETSIAYSIGPRGLTGPVYDVRSFDGRTWWPLYQRSQALQVADFVANIGDPDGCFLAAFGLSWSTLHSSRDFTKASFDANHAVRQVLVSSRDHRRTLAHRSAYRLLFCNGFVYQEGGEPAYFGTRSARADATTLSLRIGGLGIGSNQPGDRWHLGLPEDRRRRAAHRSLVFHIEDIGEACRALEAEGHRPIVEEQATVVRRLTPAANLTEFCADALARTLLNPPKAMSEEYRTKMSKFSALVDLGSLIPGELSREIVEESLGETAVADAAASTGIEQEWAYKVMSELNRLFPPMLTIEDEIAISELGTS